MQSDYASKISVSLIRGDFRADQEAKKETAKCEQRSKLMDL
jgi:hypothetical protein